MNTLETKDYISACAYELRKAEASLAYDTKDPRRIARLKAAQKAMSEARGLLVNKK